MPSSMYIQRQKSALARREEDVKKLTKKFGSAKDDYVKKSCAASLRTAKEEVASLRNKLHMNQVEVEG